MFPLTPTITHNIKTGGALQYCFAAYISPTPFSSLYLSNGYLIVETTDYGVLPVLPTTLENCRCV